MVTPCGDVLEKTLLDAGAAAAGARAIELPASTEPLPISYDQPVTPIWRPTVDDLARLVAIQDIRDVISRYALLFDDKNWAAFSELWADDAVWAVRDGMAFDGKEALMEFVSTCLPDDYSGKHMNSPPLVVVAEDGKTASAQTDVVWVSQDFENRILARYVDDFVKQGGRWVFRRRVEEPLPFIAGPPPMSDTAMQISKQTMAPS